MDKKGSDLILSLVPAGGIERATLWGKYHEATGNSRQAFHSSLASCVKRYRLRYGSQQVEDKPVIFIYPIDWNNPKTTLRSLHEVKPAPIRKSRKAS